MKCKICPDCNYQNVDYISGRCSRCNSDIRNQQIVETYVSNGFVSAKSEFLARYIRILGLIILILSVVGAVYFVLTFSRVTEIVSLLGGVEEKFSPVGIACGIASIASGMFFHAIALGIASLLEQK